jgi:NAD(P)-dependent dehydrogenase (short-subunit alcohol dehydrogenase family)
MPAAEAQTVSTTPIYPDLAGKVAVVTGGLGGIGAAACRALAASAEQQQQWTAAFLLGRMGMPEDVAQATLFPASASSAWLTGVTLDIAGGKVML